MQNRHKICVALGGRRMVNALQIALYKLSGIAPMIIFVGISLWKQGFSKWLCITLIVLGVVLCGYAPIFIRTCRKKLPVIPVKVNELATNDQVVVIYLITYMLPIINVAWKDNLWAWISFAILMVIAILISSSMSFSPILLLFGYRCYRAKISDWRLDCVLICRQKRITNPDQIENVLRINEYLLISKGEG